jgi:Na+-transporting NADH:ubiquinone oxidoreductase subunit B
MMTVIIAMIPCHAFGIYNVGDQHFLALGQQATWDAKVMIGLVQVVPIIIVSYATGLRSHPRWSQLPFLRGDPRS